MSARLKRNTARANQLAEELERLIKSDPQHKRVGFVLAVIEGVVDEPTSLMGSCVAVATNMEVNASRQVIEHLNKRLNKDCLQ